MMRPLTRLLVSWSGGKDSTLMLDRLRRDPSYEVTALVTTLDAASHNVSAHGVPIDLIEQQAESIGLPLIRVALPPTPSNDAYLGAWSDALQPMIASGVRTIAFGDIFLEDLRRWRETSFHDIGFETLFPLWGESSNALAEEFFAKGYAAVVCCASDACLDETHVGRLYDRHFIETLPPQADCCGENGEFHTFAFEGPVFRNAVRYTTGTKHHRPNTHGTGGSGDWFLELNSHA